MANINYLVGENMFADFVTDIANVSISNVYSTIGSLTDMAYDVVAFSDNNIFIRSGVYLQHWNGTTWTTITTIASTDISQIKKIKKIGGEMYMINDSNVTGYISKYDGTTWTIICSFISNDTEYGNSNANDIVIYGSNIYICGGFTSVNGVSVNHIAVWDGSSWSNVGSGISTFLYSFIRCMAIVGTTLYIGGSFTLNGETDIHFATLIGSQFYKFSQEFNATPVIMVVNGTVLYIGGYGGSPSISYWDGTSLTSLNNPNDSYVNYIRNSIVIYGTDIYVGGEFPSVVDGITVNYIAKYNGSTWSALTAGGFNYYVSALDIAGNTLYIGGNFTSSSNGDTSISYIAKLEL